MSKFSFSALNNVNEDGNLIVEPQEEEFPEIQKTTPAKGKKSKSVELPKKKKRTVLHLNPEAILAFTSQEEVEYEKLQRKRDQAFEKFLKVPQLTCFKCKGLHTVSDTESKYAQQVADRIYRKNENRDGNFLPDSIPPTACHYCPEEVYESYLNSTNPEDVKLAGIGKYIFEQIEMYTPEKEF